MTTQDVVHNSDPAHPPCSVVILHETGEALEHAAALYESVQQTCPKHLELQMLHWPLTALTDDELGEAAAAAAAFADIVVVAASAEGRFPAVFNEWVERWLTRRDGREGALVGLLLGERTGVSDLGFREIQLHHLALRAGMDYLKRLPNTPGCGIPDLTEWCTMRAATKTGILDQIIQTEPKATAL